MSEQFSDLTAGLQKPITQIEDGSYFDIVIRDLDPDTLYSAKFAWDYEDNEKTNSEFSDVFIFETDEVPEIDKPEFRTEDLGYAEGLLIIKWSGKTYLGQSYGDNLKHIEIHLAPSADVYSVHGEFLTAGEKTIAKEPDTYSVKLRAVSKNNKFSAFSNVQTVVAKAQPPLDVTNVIPSFLPDETYEVKFTHDPNVARNKYLLEYRIDLSGDGGAPKPFQVIPNYSAINNVQVFRLSFSEAEALYGVAPNEFSGTIYTWDKYLNKASSAGVQIPSITRSTSLQIPDFQLIGLEMAYKVIYDEQTNKSFKLIEVEEYKSTDLTPGNFQVVARGIENPIVVPAEPPVGRYVRLKTYSKSGLSPGYTVTKFVQPKDSGGTDGTPPADVDVTNVSWSGDNLVITFTPPAEDIGVTARAYLTYNSEVRYFDFPIIGTSSQSVTIYGSQMYGRWGEYPSSFTYGKMTSIDTFNQESSGDVFTSFLTSLTKVNPLGSIIPDINVVGVENGYEVTGVSVPSSAYSIKIYASKTAGFTPSSNNLVYSGILPAFIIDTTYTPTYIRVKYETITGQSSLFSVEKTVTSLSVAQLSLLEFPIGLGTEGTIWSGPLQDNDNDGEPDKDSNGHLIPDQNGARAFFNRRGFFIYDDLNALTTQIIGDGTLYNNPYAGTGGAINENKLTFITKSAQIANWRVSTDRIENDLITPNGDTYTGMSGSGDFAFWAGASISGNVNSLAKFQVTHAGKVTARNIDILGGKLRVGAENDTDAPFLVDSSGNLKASKANITGEIEAQSGKITGKLEITSRTVTVNGSPVTYDGYIIVGNSNDSGARVALKKTGIRAYSSTSTSDSDYSTAIHADATGAGNTFYTNAAIIGDWIVNSSSISKDATDGTITLSSTNTKIEVQGKGSFSGYTAGISAPTARSGDNIIFYAGANGRSTDSPFYVTLDGTIKANKGAIAGWDISTNQISKGDVALVTTSTASTQPAFWAGAKPSTEGATEFDRPFYITYGGKLKASNAEITGKIQATEGYFGSATNGWKISGNTIVSKSSTNPIILNAETDTITGGTIQTNQLQLSNGDYINSDGQFKLGDEKFIYTKTYNAQNQVTGTLLQLLNTDFYLGSTSSQNYLKTDGSFSLGNGKISGNNSGININGGEVTFELTGTLETDDNGFAGDRMVGLNSSNKLTQTRRLVHNGQRDITNANISGWSGNSGTFTSGSLSVSVKGGDLIMVGDAPLS